MYAKLTSRLADGRIASRFRARHYSLQPVETQYIYDPNTAKLMDIDYKGDETTPDARRVRSLTQLAGSNAPIPGRF